MNGGSRLLCVMLTSYQHNTLLYLHEYKEFKIFYTVKQRSELA
jgi:hypothetical protein